jgi:Tol biopolymer transport system component
LHVVNADGSGGRNILDLATAGLYRGLGNALWSPDGDKIIFAFHDGSDDGVWEISPEGGVYRRLDSSVPGEWPRYWSQDGQWLITVAGDGMLYALDTQGNLRVPFSSMAPTPILDPRYGPWRGRAEPRCEQQEDSWWKCK